MTDFDKKMMTTTDWGTIRRNIERSREILERGFRPTVGEKKRIFKERANALARPFEKKDQSERYLEVVAFLLAHERYALEKAYIREVFPLKKLTPLPCTPAFVVGIINIRGEILSVVDLKKFFELPEKGITDLNKVVIIHADEMEFGILVDAIIGVTSIPFSKLQPSLPTLTGIREEYLRGVTGERLVILDAGKLLRDRNIIVHEVMEG